MDFTEYESRISRPVKVKATDFQAGERLTHMIFADQFNRRTLERLCRTADRIRLIAKSKEGACFLKDLLRHKRAMLYFTQPSTRTYLSFEAACQILGISCCDVRDRSTSSEAKGESPFDSMRMFSSYFDVVIMRSKMPKFAECCAYMMNDLRQTSDRYVPIVNGGAGADEHPTQALLDIYTIQRALGLADNDDWEYYDEMRTRHGSLRAGIDGKVFGFCGDVRRGRTIRSLTTLLSRYDDVSMYFVSPSHPKLAMTREFRRQLEEMRHVTVREFQSFEDTIDGRPVVELLDCLYMTRIQREHNSTEDEAEFREIDFSLYKLTPERVARMKPHAPILHPFPRDDEFGEIPPAIDTDPRAHYFRQARNGMWARAALLAYLFDVDSTITDYYEDFTRMTRDYNEGAL